MVLSTGRDCPYWFMLVVEYPQVRSSALLQCSRRITSALVPHRMYSQRAWLVTDTVDILDLEDTNVPLLNGGFRISAANSVRLSVLGSDIWLWDQPRVERWCVVFASR